MCLVCGRVGCAIFGKVEFVKVAMGCGLCRGTQTKGVVEPILTHTEPDLLT